MATLRTKSYLLTRFEAGDRPTDVDFADLFESICILGETGLGSGGQTTGFDGNVTIGGTLTLTGQLQMPAELMVGSITETLSMPIQAYSSTDETVIFASGSISDNLFQGVSGDSTSSIRLQDDITHVRFGTHTNKGFLEVHGEEIIYYTTGSSVTPNLVHISGSVGINTEGAGTIYNLDVHGDTNGIIRAYGPTIGRYSLENSSRHYSLSVQNSDWYFFDETGGTTRMLINSSGNVGMGTTSPSARLDIVTSGDEGLEVNVATGHAAAVFTTALDYVARFISSDATSGIVIQDVNSTSNANKIEVVTNTMHLTTNNNRNVTILDTGNVGIGTTAPGHLLHLFDDTNDVRLKIQTNKTDGIAQIRFQNDVQEFVAGTTATDRFVVYDSTNATTPFTIEPNTGNHTLYLDSNEKIGIGKSNPQEKLTIESGHISMSNNYGLIKRQTVALNTMNYGIYPYQGGNSYSFSNISNSPTPGTAGLKLESDQYIHFVESDGNTLGVQFDMNTKQFRFDGPITASHFIGDGSGLTGVNAQQVVGFIANDVNNYITTAVGNGTLNGEANLQFDGSQLYVNGEIGVGQSNPTAQIEVGTTRPLYIGAGANPASPSTEGSISSQGSSAGGWANYFKFLGSSKTDHGGFYGLGNIDSFTRWGIAPAYDSDYGLHVVAAGSGATAVKVGIGTVSPSSMLHIHADSTATASLHIESDGSNNDSSIHLRQTGAVPGTAGTAGTGVDLVYDGGADYFMLKGYTFQDGLEGEGFKYRPETDDNTLVLREHYKIGMGTLSPSYNLHIVSGSGHPSIMVETQGTDKGAFIRFKDDNQHWRIGKNTGDNFAVYDSTGDETPFSVEKSTPTSTLYLKDNGNIGIGTNNPTHKLQVMGKGIFSSSNYVDLRVDQSDSGQAALSVTSGTGKVNLMSQKNDASFSSDIEFRHLDETGTLISRSIYATEDGKVGIGTATVNAKFYVHGGSYDYSPSNGGTGMIEWVGGATSLYTGYLGIDDDAVHLGHNSGTRDLRFQTNETTRMTIEAGGNVGIGITQPTAKLHLKKEGDSLGEVEFLKMNINSSTTEGTGSIVFADSGDPDDQNMKIRFYEGNRNRLSFDGRAVISATNHVSDNILVLETNNAGGRVGINTGAPTHNLHVVGDTNITGDLTVGGSYTVGGLITFPTVADTGGTFPIRQQALKFPGTDDRAIIDYGFTADDAFEFRILLQDGNTDKFIVSSSGTAAPNMDMNGVQTSFYPGIHGEVGIGTVPAHALHVYDHNGPTIGNADMANSWFMVGNVGAGIGMDPNEIYKSGDHLYIATFDDHDILMRANKKDRIKIYSDAATDSGSIGLGHGLYTQIGYPRLSSYASFSHKSLDSTVIGNYALLQSSGGTTYLNASSGKNIYFRENNSTKMILNDGVLGIGPLSDASTQRFGVNSSAIDDVSNPYNYGNSADGRVGLHIFDSTADNNEITDYILIETKNSDVIENPGQGAGIRWLNHDSNNSCGASIRNHVINDASSNFGQNSETAGNLIFAVSKHADGGKLTDRMIITGRGQFGVGTNNPAEFTKFHITSNHNTGLLIEGDNTIYMALNTTDADKPVGILFREQGSNRVTMGFDGATTQAAMLYGSGFDGNNAGIRIDSGGRVSINTTTSLINREGGSSGNWVSQEALLNANGSINSTSAISADSFYSWGGENVGNTYNSHWFEAFHMPLENYGFNSGKWYFQAAGDGDGDQISATIDFCLKNQSGSAPGHLHCSINNYGPRKLQEDHFEVIQWSNGAWNGGGRDGTSDAVNASSYPRYYDVWIKNDGKSHDNFNLTKLGKNKSAVNFGNLIKSNTNFQTMLTHADSNGNGSSRWDKKVIKEIMHQDMNNDGITYYGNRSDRYTANNIPRLIVQGRTNEGTAVGFQDNDSDNLWMMGYSNNVGTDSLQFMHTSAAGTEPTSYAYLNQVNRHDLQFTGQHRCMPAVGQATDYANHIGKIVSSTGEYDNSDEGINKTNPSINEALPKVKLSNESNDKRAFGIISDKEDPNDDTRTLSQGAWHSVTSKSDTRLIINSLGEGGIWVSNYNGNLVNGDYITTSPIEGVGQKQNDDLLHNYTVAKITQDCNFDNETDLVTCQAPDGTYQMKFVGCTYHCG